MNDIISKELLSEVLGLPFCNIQKVQIGNSIISYTTYSLPTHKYKKINIYELANKCKEYANKQGYWSSSGYDERYYCMLKDMPDNQWFYGDTEIEAIFKACQWIYGNRSEK